MSVSDQSNSTDRIFHWVEAAAHDSRLPDTPGALAAVRLIAEEFRGRVPPRGQRRGDPDRALGRSKLGPPRRLCGHPAQPRLSLLHRRIARCVLHRRRRPSGAAGRSGPRDGADFARAPVAGKIVRCDWEFLSGFGSTTKSSTTTIQAVLTEATPISTHTLLAETFPMNLRRAREAGAVGFVGVLRDTTTGQALLRQRGLPRLRRKPVPDPGLWVSSSTGASLRQLVDSRDELAVSLLLEGELAPRPAVPSSARFRARGRRPTRWSSSSRTTTPCSPAPSRTRPAPRRSSTWRGACRPSLLLNETGAYASSSSTGTSEYYAAQRRYIERHSLADVAMAVSVEHIGLELVDEMPALASQAVQPTGSSGRLRRRTSSER